MRIHQYISSCIAAGIDILCIQHWTLHARQHPSGTQHRTCVKCLIYSSERRDAEARFASTWASLCLCLWLYSAEAAQYTQNNNTINVYTSHVETESSAKFALSRVNFRHLHIILCIQMWRRCHCLASRSVTPSDSTELEGTDLSTTARLHELFVDVDAFYGSLLEYLVRCEVNSWKSYGRFLTTSVWPLFGFSRSRSAYLYIFWLMRLILWKRSNNVTLILVCKKDYSKSTMPCVARQYSQMKLCCGASETNKLWRAPRENWAIACKTLRLSFA